MRRRARRSTTRDGESPRRASTERHWAGPSRRARLIAGALAVALAVLTFAVVSREWRRAAPPPPAPPTSVEARLIATPPAPPSAPH